MSGPLFALIYWGGVLCLWAVLSIIAVGIYRLVEFVRDHRVAKGVRVDLFNADSFLRWIRSTEKAR